MNKVEEYVNSYKHLQYRIEDIAAQLSVYNHYFAQGFWELCSVVGDFGADLERGRYPEFAGVTAMLAAELDYTAADSKFYYEFLETYMGECYSIDEWRYTYKSSNFELVGDLVLGRVRLEHEYGSTRLVEFTVNCDIFTKFFIHFDGNTRLEREQAILEYAREIKGAIDAN